MPPMLLGLLGDNTYANCREANRALWARSSPACEGLAPWFPEAALAVDLDRVPALAEDRERLWTQVSSAESLSADEKRAILELE
ncbi:hypothetical protein [Altererythrobacter sp. C41]|uniref:hypothetical protein n=1 Tax=Altererythrobacter sp. C41 TaxID=2806021 RepID=UPI003FCE7E91